jgi:hypothetical protein
MPGGGGCGIKRSSARAQRERPSRRARARWAVGERVRGAPCMSMLPYFDSSMRSSSEPSESSPAAMSTASCATVRPSTRSTAARTCGAARRRKSGFFSTRRVSACTIRGTPAQLGAREAKHAWGAAHTFTVNSSSAAGAMAVWAASGRSSRRATGSRVTRRRALPPGGLHTGDVPRPAPRVHGARTLRTTLGAAGELRVVQACTPQQERRAAQPTMPGCSLRRACHFVTHSTLCGSAQPHGEQGAAHFSYEFVSELTLTHSQFTPRTPLLVSLRTGHPPSRRAVLFSTGVNTASSCS